MQELLERLAENFDEVDGSIRIVDVAWIGEGLKLGLTINLNDEQPTEHWEINCKYVVDESICSEWTSTLELSSQSPLLKPFIEPIVDLSFSENSVSPALLLGIVYSCCAETFERTDFISKFINLRPTVSGIASSKFGLLGRFPESVADKILSALEGQPIKISKLPGRIDKQWTGSEFIEHPNLTALMIGASYIIGSEFSAHPKPHGSSVMCIRT